jgi:hypothetical protein
MELQRDLHSLIDVRRSRTRHRCSPALRRLTPAPEPRISLLDEQAIDDLLREIAEPQKHDDPDKEG